MNGAAARDPTDFIRANTRLLPVPHAPEIRLHLADEALPLWSRTEEELAEAGLPPPFWAFAWAGGQALARYLLDKPAFVAGRRVLDIGSGSGLVAIAAAKAGAAHVSAVDLDRFAVAAIGLNAAANGAALDVCRADALAGDPPDGGVVLVGDLFYDREIAALLLPWLKAARARGADVLIGDPGRAYLPRAELETCAEYDVPVTRELEDLEIKRTAVWRFA